MRDGAGARVTFLRVCGGVQTGGGRRRCGKVTCKHDCAVGAVRCIKQSAGAGA